jgi:adenylate cyclase class IV
LELEILARDRGSETVRAAQNALFSLLEETGLDRTSLESRYYTELLRGEGL